MDMDAFAAVHRDDWERLDELTSRRRLTGAEADELLQLYQRASTHLSVIRSVAPEGALSASLSMRLSRARTRFTGARSNFFEDLAGFFVYSLPAAFYRVRWLTVAVGVLFTAVAWLAGAWVVNTPGVLAAMGTDAELLRYVESDFVNYYSENPAASFAGMVWTNNAWIALQAVAFGVTGIWGPYILYQNAIGVGTAGGMMASFGQLDVFFTYILPHGFMELTAIFVAAAAGLQIFWALVSPGPRTRMTALAQEGRSLMTVALGLVVVLFISGLVEGFVTPSGLPAWLRIGIGAAVFAAYWAYTLILGKRACQAGYRGDLLARDAGEASVRAA
ncbi:stage II sporulation protein M [Arthrobacter caoxuetaonis]|uniref:Stage II sporulation protein M n=1 Tax=Arthrobacter caoxuetaonis TaxID=2886935 RepID=A0A9X1SBH8_9MICC|nr:stage II sporulation protein M [Arthrobacter caoxuetaonis]MCC3282329.1 stage II sporulation protein M [Arthrobacter caoxuetaonis]MCC3297283.1 stage II sporulation protein M [Arthrobacter caoxuetaonis]USQ58165.1 stage II sporulation protein M [Arthrobacter caoxuetaonis]